MKKVVKGFAIFMLALILCSCGSGNEKYTKTCSLEQQGTILEMVAIAPSKNANVDKIVMNVSMSYEEMGIKESDITDEVKKVFTDTLSKSLLQSMGVDENQGVKVVKNEFDASGYILNAEIDVKALQQALDTDENEDVSVDAFVEEMTNNGMKCE